MSKLHNCPLWTVAKSLVLEMKFEFKGIRCHYKHVHRMCNSFSDNHRFPTSGNVPDKSSPRN